MLSFVIWAWFWLQIINNLFCVFIWSILKNWHNFRKWKSIINGKVNFFFFKIVINFASKVTITYWIVFVKFILRNMSIIISISFIIIFDFDLICIILKILGNVFIVIVGLIIIIFINFRHIIFKIIGRLFLFNDAIIGLIVLFIISIVFKVIGKIVIIHSTRMVKIQVMIKTTRRLFTITIMIRWNSALFWAYFVILFLFVNFIRFMNYIRVYFVIIFKFCITFILSTCFVIFWSWFFNIQVYWLSFSWFFVNRSNAIFVNFIWFMNHTRIRFKSFFRIKLFFVIIFQIFISFKLFICFIIFWSWYFNIIVNLLFSWFYVNRSSAFFFVNFIWFINPFRISFKSFNRIWVCFFIIF